MKSWGADNNSCNFSQYCIGKRNYRTLNSAEISILVDGFLNFVYICEISAMSFLVSLRCVGKDDNH